MFENEEERGEKKRKRRQRVKRRRPLLGKRNLRGVENTEAIPRTYHRPRLQPGSTLFNPVRPCLPSKEAAKRDETFFSAIFSVSFALPAVCRAPSRQNGRSARSEMLRSFLKNAHPAPVLLACLRTRDHAFPSLGKVSQTLKMHDIRQRRRETPRIDNRVHNGQTLLIAAVTRAPFLSYGNFFMEEISVLQAESK